MLRVAAAAPAAALVSTLALLLAPTGSVGAASPTTLRLDGIGPLKLGMSRADAVRTGWLSDRSTGCPLGGKPYPVGYRLRGRGAPAAVSGSAEFTSGRLTTLTFTKGVRTAAGVLVGSTSTARMVAAYRARGYAAKATSSPTFGGTFVDVRKGGHPVIGGFGTGRTVTTLALRAVPVCE